MTISGGPICSTSTTGWAAIRPQRGLLLPHSRQLSEPRREPWRTSLLRTQVTSSAQGGGFDIRLADGAREVFLVEVKHWLSTVGSKSLPDRSRRGPRRGVGRRHPVTRGFAPVSDGRIELQPAPFISASPGRSPPPPSLLSRGYLPVRTAVRRPDRPGRVRADDRWSHRRRRTQPVRDDAQLTSSLRAGPPKQGDEPLSPATSGLGSRRRDSPPCRSGRGPKRSTRTRRLSQSVPCRIGGGRCSGRQARTRCRP